MDPEAVLGELDEDQREAVTSAAMPLAVIAPAGSGKTRVLTSRIVHRAALGEIEPEHILCVTFTRKAAVELQGRLRSMGLRDRIEAGTFHGVAWRILQDRWAAAGRTAPQLLDSARSFLQEQVVPDVPPREVADLATEITWARARLVRPDAYEEAALEAGRRTRRPMSWIAEQFEKYEAAKSRSHVVDFDDLLAACTSAIEGDKSFAAAQRWRFRHLFVDEFQDVNPLQFALLEAWRGDRWDAFVVGDTHQSIYGWNGADPSLLTTLYERWTPLETLHLDRTHRSTPQITAAAASVIKAAGLPDRHPRSAGSPGPDAEIRAHRDEVEEITTVGTLIRRRRGPDAPWRSFAVLARTHDQVVDMERGLSAAGVPTRQRRTESWSQDGGYEDSDDLDAVTISTIHAAKGLEWPIVHIVGCEDGSIPHSSARRRSARDEEARLLYVAITRAGLEVNLHWAQARNIRGVVRERTRSKFLEDFESRTVGTPNATEATSAADRVHAMRAEVPEPPPANPLLDALLEWREGRARAARTDPEVVLADESLAAIAEIRPTDVETILSVEGIGPARGKRYAAELLAIVHGTPAGADLGQR